MWRSSSCLALASSLGRMDQPLRAGYRTSRALAASVSTPCLQRPPLLARGRSTRAWPAHLGWLFQQPAPKRYPASPLIEAVVHATASFSQVVQLCSSTPPREERHYSPSSLPLLPQKESHWTSCATELLQPLEVGGLASCSTATSWMRLSGMRGWSCTCPPPSGNLFPGHSLDPTSLTDPRPRGPSDPSMMERRSQVSCSHGCLALLEWEQTQIHE